MLSALVVLLRSLALLCCGKFSFGDLFVNCQFVLVNSSLVGARASRFQKCQKIRQFLS
jgi:hypothetical protein